MSSDTTVELVKSLARTMQGRSRITEPSGPVTDWEAMAMVLEFGDGFRSAHGYAYSSGDVTTPVSCRWDDIRETVDAYLDSLYQPGDKLPVKILVQFDRTNGQYDVTFEDSDESRWKITPRNVDELPGELRPNFG